MELAYLREIDSLWELEYKAADWHLEVPTEFVVIKMEPPYMMAVF